MDTQKNIGVVILGVIPNSRAEKAGFKRGDKILSINDKPVNDIIEYLDAIKNETAKKVDIIRNNTYMEIYMDLNHPKIDLKNLDFEQLTNTLDK